MVDGQHATHWMYPCNARALKKVGIYLFAHYIGVRQQTISIYIDNWPISNYVGMEWGDVIPTVHMFWWDQPMNLDNKTSDGVDDAESDMVQEYCFCWKQMVFFYCVVE